MTNFPIISIAQAVAIESAYNHCSCCSSCPLNTPEGWRCGYLHEQAAAYLNAHKEGNSHA